MTPAPEALADEDECPVCADGPQDDCSSCWGTGTGEDGYRCTACGGRGEAVPDHCCGCGGSPYCVGCHRCGRDCIGDCRCPVVVQMADGSTKTL